MEHIEKNKKQALEMLKVRYEERIKQLCAPAEADPQRIAQRW
ncbi:MAG: hypothetical protein R2827_08690 [Bdellovibrionales bacterium]